VNECIYPDIILHWDSDDWSHPNRIAEQVALLESSGKQCVGYRDMLFWRLCPGCWTGNSWLPLCPKCCPHCKGLGGEAWLYANRQPTYCLGTSLCYWRSVWEAKPFPDLPKGKGSTGEDTQWLQGLDSLGVSSVASQDVAGAPAWQTQVEAKDQPRMIASVHGANTMPYDARLFASPEFRRTPEWDELCRATMAL
jgi:hypothetical protein